ncbi:MAG TPA: PIN domain-containing protein [Mobilitalea sp.]|nr:PIN domain-containing protein [Mobilitalea sp.]
MYISSDTNIWIDFQIIGALELPFKLSHKFYMSEESLKEELLTPPGIDKRLINYGLLMLELTEEEFFYAYGVREKHPQLSSYDALALAIAKKRGFILLTGDKRLRNAAIEEGVENCGTLWVFDELLRENIVTEQEYIDFMREIKKHNGDDIRLPMSEIEIRIK